MNSLLAEDSVGGSLQTMSDVTSSQPFLLNVLSVDVSVSLDVDFLDGPECHHSCTLPESGPLVI